MPPRPAACCSRALHRQIASPLENIWVPDALLASAFERYFAVSHVRRRRASSTPGPLESRRRLGKRRLGALNAGYAPSALPDWALTDALDLSKWKWEPPTMPSVREERKEAQLQLARHWLGQFLVPPSVREEAKKPEPPAPPTPLELLEQFQSRVSTEPLPDLAQACDDICVRLKDGTEGLGVRTSVLEALDGVREALTARYGISSKALYLSAQLLSAVAKAIFATTRGSKSKLDIELSQGLLARLLDLPAGDVTCDIFERTMKVIPESDLDALAAPIEGIVSKFLLSWGDTPWDVSQAQVSSISRALSRLNPKGTSVFMFAKAFLLEQTGDLNQLHKARLAWLSVLAHLPRIDSPTLYLAFQDFFFNDHALSAAVSTSDLCDLLLRHWSCTFTMKDASRHIKSFQSLLHSGPSAGIAALAQVVYEGHKGWGGKIIELCSILKSAGRIDELATSFSELAQRHDIRGILLQKVAAACGDYRVALRLYDVCRNSGSRTRTKRKNTVDQGRWRTWDTGSGDQSWSRYLGSALKDPSASTTDVWALLNLCRPTEETVMVAAEMAFKNAHSGDMSSRTQLRKVSACIKYMRKAESTLPTRAVLAAYRVVTSDLAEGNWGRTTRLLWFIDLVRRECGPEKAEQCRKMLLLWRQKVAQVKGRLAQEGDKTS